MRRTKTDLYSMRNIVQKSCILHMVISKSCILLIPLNDVKGVRLHAFDRKDEACTRRCESKVLILLRAKNVLLLISLAIIT